LEAMDKKHLRTHNQIGLLMLDLFNAGVFKQLKIALKFINHKKWIGQPSQEIFNL